MVVVRGEAGRRVVMAPRMWGREGPLEVEVK